MNVYNLTLKELIRELENVACDHEGAVHDLLIHAANVLKDQSEEIERIDNENENLSEANDKYESEVIELKEEIATLEEELSETHSALDALVDEVLEEL